LGDGKVVLGPFCKLTEAAVYEIIGLAGFDFAIIDMEHGPISYETAQNLIRTCELVGISPVVRVPKNEEHYILKALDIGAHGIEAPEINSKEQAEKLVESSRYYPLGKRGVCRFVRAAEYSKTPKEKYFFQANENTVVIGHLEGREGLANLDAILEVQGLNVIFIGPYDLSQSLGIPGQVHHPDLIEAMKVIVTKAKSRNKTVGTFVETPEDAKFWMAQGVTYIAYSVDVALILEKFSLIVNTVKPTGG
ncbi:MAG: HpcH/HpaI aldolase family protein, partial [Bacteroidota bacterium]